MFFVNSLLPVDSRILEEAILTIAGEKNQSRKDTIEGRLVAIIKEISNESGFDRYVEWSIKVNEIRTHYNEGKPDDRHASSQWIGKRLKSMSLRNRMVHGYSEIRITLDEYDMLLKQYGYTGRESSKPTNSLPENTEQDQNVLRDVESGRESAQGGLIFNSDKEYHFFQKKMIALQDDGVTSWNDRWLLAREALEEWRKTDELPF